MDYFLKQKGFNDEEQKAKRAFQPGMELYGYCGGIFGRDSYDIKTIKEVNGNQIICFNSEGHYVSGVVDSWVSLLESSNLSLESEEY